MRSFPGAAGRRALATTVFATTLLAAVVPLALASDGTDDLKDKQHQVQGQIEQAQADAEEAKRVIELDHGHVVRDDAQGGYGATG